MKQFCKTIGTGIYLFSCSAFQEETMDLVNRETMREW